VLINKERAVEFGERENGTIWISVEHGFHRQWDWTLGKDALLEFQTKVEGMLEWGYVKEAKDYVRRIMKCCDMARETDRILKFAEVEADSCVNKAAE
jgi:hypothetical protein